ncbi:MAG: DUF3368 domain-containing protein [Candidatus Kuenenia sp.]|nr:DUF3368 domain-containing protein [Candidatus Kuenenia sp.]
MIVFCNTTPLIALSSIGKLELLPSLFGKIYVVTEVVEECAAGGPIAVPDISGFSWIEVVESEMRISNHFLLELDKGEKFTLHMAQKMGAQRVIIDEKIGRNIAEYLCIPVIGTLGVLLNAKRKQLIPSFTDSVMSMCKHGLRYHPGLIKKLIAEVGE